MKRRAVVMGTVALLFLGAGCAKQPDMSSVSALGAGGSYHGNEAVTLADSRPADSRPKVAEYAAVPEMSDVHFDFDKYEIRPEGARALDESAAWLKTNAKQILIEGHCDMRGTSEYNVVLGERRAKATMNYLVSRGVDSRRIAVVSYGDDRPQCHQNNEACWAKNRRAHFLAKVD
jgi:peptidoglycan-associated lipoprotein